MEITKIAKKNIYENKIKRIIKVAAYVRVSSEQDSSSNSYESQKKYFLNKIKTNPSWIFAGIYGDEGKSGGTTHNREEFLKMLIDAEKGKIDLILTKSISRFARNTLDTLKYVRKLKEMGVSVLFEEENINTMELQNELLLSIVSSVAQQEVINLSENVKYGIHQVMKNGNNVGFTGCYGYDYNNQKDKYFIKETEAEVIRFIFEQYLKGNGVENIRQKLNDKRIPSPLGKDYWRGKTIVGILKNEKYVGDLLLGKKCTIGHLENKKIKKNEGEENQYYIKDDHQPIISRSDFEKVQSLFESKNQTYYKSKCIRRYCFSNKIRCGFCGYSLQRNVLKYTGAYYRCVANERIQKDLCNCSKTIKVPIIEKVFVELLKKLKKEKLNILNPIAKEKYEYVRQYILNKKIDGFEDEVFNALVEMIVFGNINQQGETHTFRFILKSNGILNVLPNRDFLNHNFYKIIEYNSNVETNWREYKTNKLHQVTNMRVSVEIDLDGYF